VSEPERFSIGSAVKITGGNWKGLSGKVHQLTASVGHGQALIVEADAKWADSATRFLPRNRLLVVAIGEAIPLRQPKVR